MPPANHTSVEAVPVENTGQKSARVSARAEAEAVRRESALVDSFTKCAIAKVAQT